jgi:hypothetical protein
MVVLNKWKVYCTTEQKYIEQWLEDGIVPTTCPNDSTHIVNDNSYYIVESTTTTEVIIKEENVSTGGHFRVQDICFSCPANSTKEYSFSFPVSISVLAFKMIVRPDMEGDKLHGVVSPNSLVGILTESVTIDDLIISVSDSVIENVYIGMEINLYDSINDISIDCGQILGIDKDNKQITVENKITRSFNIGDHVRVGVCMLKNIEFPKITSDFIYEVGTTKIGASYLPKNTLTCITYTNTSNTDKNCHIFYEYLY